MVFVVNFSGGKDSTAMLVWLCENYPDVPKHVVMADTGWEHEDAIEWSTGIARIFGLPLHVVRNPNKTLLTMAESRGKFPGMQQRQCTSDLKRDPIRTWIRRQWPNGGTIVSCMGLRAEESAARAKRPCIMRLEPLSKKGRDVFEWNPILGWKEEEVWAYLKKRSIPVHPVYKHLKRFSCRVCIFMTKHDVQQVAAHDPKAIKIIQGIEEKIGFTMFQSGPITEITKRSDKP
mgnify:CR=1 FL=1